MWNDLTRPGLRRILAGIVLFLAGALHAESPPARDVLVIRAVNPERQADEILKLFDGARAPHPAAALAGWKRAAHDPNRLGKPLEAVIAVFNPQMAREWRPFNDAELRIDLSAVDGKPEWWAIVPRDDGTLAAAITAQRVTDGGNDPALTERDRAFPVMRLGSRGAIFASQVGDSLAVASSRDQLLRGLRRIDIDARAIDAATVPAHARPEKSPRPLASDPFDSGLKFTLSPPDGNEGVGAVNGRRAIALLNGLGIRRLAGSLGIKDDCLSLEMTSLVADAAGSKSLKTPGPCSVDPAWLTWVPAEGVMGAVSLAFAPEPAFWGWAFDLADRIEHADPAHAQAAPLRARFNLLAAAAGTRPEVDLWPHLRGVTACVMVDPGRQGQPGEILLVLHTDQDSRAVRLATNVLPRLGALLTGNKPESHQGATPRPGDGATIGTVGGRPVLISREGRDVAIAWGNKVLSNARAAVADPSRSVSPLCTGWQRAGKKPPQRVGTVWPARCWPATRSLDTTSEAWHALAQGAPAVWWGWAEPGGAIDLLQFADLRVRVRDFLDRIPLDPSPLP